jgi:S1-C subfamily serine protease
MYPHVARIISLTFLLALTSIANVRPVAGQEDRAVTIAKIARASTVFIETSEATGSGFVIGDGYVATNHHVIEGAEEITIRLVGQTESLRATVFRDDKENDVAVLRVLGLDAPALALSRDRMPPQGSKVYVYGNPLNLEGTFSSGEVSALRGNRFIQITAPISPGSSGGPVLNDHGYVIGVAQGNLQDKEKRGQNLNLAVPIFYVTTLVNSKIALRETAPPVENSSEPFECTIVDTVSPPQLSENVQIYLQGQLVADLLVNPQRPVSSAKIKVGGEGTYSYTIVAGGVWLNQFGQTQVIPPGRSDGTVYIKRGSIFDLVLEPPYGVKLVPR